MDINEARKQRGPNRAFSILLIILMIVVILFLILVQNVDRFSDFFGSTTLKIVFDVALVVGLTLFAAYILLRGAEYRKNLESMVERLQKSNTLLQVLNAIQSSANATLDAQRLLEESLEAVMPLTSSIGTIYLLDEGTSRLKPRASYGTETPLENIPGFAIGEGMAGMVAQSGQPLEDPSGETGGGNAASRSTMARIAIPIKAGNKVMGVMIAGTTRGSYSQEENTLLHAVSGVLGNSLTNAKLYNITRRALDATKRTQSYLESFIREAKIGVLVLDNRGAVMIANREAERYLHVQLKDILGKDAITTLGGMDQRGQRLVQGFQSCLNDRLGVQFSHPVDDDPANPLVLVNVFPLFRDKDEVIGAAATFINT